MTCADSFPCNKSISEPTAPGTVVFQRLPLGLFDRLDLDRDPIEIATRHQSSDFPRNNLEIDDRAVPHVGTTTRKPICVVAVGLQIFAPCFTPETPGNRPSVRLDRVQFLAFLSREPRLPSGHEVVFRLRSRKASTSHPHLIKSVTPITLARHSSDQGRRTAAVRRLASQLVGFHSRLRGAPRPSSSFLPKDH